MGSKKHPKRKQKGLFFRRLASENKSALVRAFLGRCSVGFSAVGFLPIATRVRLGAFSLVVGV